MFYWFRRRKYQQPKVGTRIAGVISWTFPVERIVPKYERQLKIEHREYEEKWQFYLIN